MVPNPQSPGTFDPGITPTVSICAVVDSDCGTAAADTIAVFTTTTGPGSELVRADPVGQTYIVNWHTDAFALDTLRTYRISVSVLGSRIGYADVDVVSSGKDVKNVATGEFVPLVDGRTLPIKFRAEVGMVTSVAITPATDSLSAGGQAQLTATVRDAHGAVISGRAVTWQSSNPSVASVSASGQVTALALGVATITATADSVPGTAQIVVRGVSYSTISAAGPMTCGTTTAHETYCWGGNTAGLLGIGTSDNTPHPVPLLVTGGHAFTTVSNANAHTCAIDTSAAAYCWGYGSDTRLGTGLDQGSDTPVAVAGGHSFAQVDVGYNHACAIATDQQAYCWGYGMLGDLGVSSNPAARGNAAVPTLVVGGLHFAQIAAGDNFTCAITTGHATYCWGLDNYGQLGGPAPTSYNCDPYACALDPQQIVGAPEFLQVTAGETHACGLTANGQVYCWGSNSLGQLGDGTTTDRGVPTVVPGLSGVIQIDAGSFSTCAVTSSGAIYCWGLNQYGQLGNGSNANSATPVQIVTSSVKFRHVSDGTSHACAIATTGALYCWGYNADGELGDGSVVNRSTPVLVQNPQ